MADSLFPDVLGWLDQHEATLYFNGESSVCADPDGGLLRYGQALRAVLTRHAADLLGDCKDCRSADAFRVPWPCDTWRDIVRALDVSPTTLLAPGGLPTDPVVRLRLAAAGRRAYARTAPAEQVEILEIQAAAYETAARIVHSDTMLALVIPSDMVPPWKASS